MKTKIFSILSAALAFIMSACSTDMVPEPDAPSGSGDSILRLEIQKQDLTRGAITSTSFEKGESVFVVISDKEHPDPLTFTSKAVYNGQKWILEEKIDLSAETSGVAWTSANVDVYYPYDTFSKAYNPKNSTQFIIENPLDQEDLLYGRAIGINSENPSAKVSCNHLKTRLTFELKNNSDSPVGISKMSVDTEGEQLFIGRYGYINGGYFYIPDEYTKTLSINCNIEIPARESTTLDFLIAPTEQAYEMMNYRMLEEGISKTVLKITLEGTRTINFDIEAQPWEPGRQYTYPVSVGQPSDYNGHDYVDLGLPSGLKWATCNIGASTPENRGNYYSWGETSTKNYYDEYNSLTFKKNVSELLDMGVIDANGNLTEAYDAARVNWGGTWRMPTRTECEELVKKCSCRWTTQNGINGYEIIGPNENSIFLPMTGGQNGDIVSGIETVSYYSSATMYTGSIGWAYYIKLTSTLIDVNVSRQWYGMVVRAVSE